MCTCHSPRLPCEVRGRFFQESVLHLQFPSAPFQLPQPRAFRDLQRWLVILMCFTIGTNPISQAGLTDSQLTSDVSDRPRRLDHHPRSFFPKLGSELPIF